MSNEMRVAELEGMVRYHSELYYNQSNPEITDAEFDALVDELKALDPTNAALQEAGALPSYGRKVKHASMMGSLDKATEVPEVQEWFSKYKDRSVLVGIGPKMDGLSLRVDYKDGRLVEAATRGDGETGQDVTDNVKVMNSIPSLIEGFTGEVRGEVYMRKSVWERLNAELQKRGEKTFANPRNAASGSLMAKDPQVTAERCLDFAAFDVIPDDHEFMEVKDRYAYMKNELNGVEVVELEMVSIGDVEAIVEHWGAERVKLDYCIDGMVLELNSLLDQIDSGWNGKRPRGRLAFKFPPEQTTTVLKDIDWQVGRTGRLTPVARIKPTYLDGSTISNVTLHNKARVDELGIRMGCEVLIEKAGDIIPQVVRVTAANSSLDEVKMPESCPSCDSPVELDENGVSLWCKNPACPAQLERRVLHWLDRMEVLGVGSGIVHGLCSGGYVKDLADLYALEHSEMRSVTGGDRAAEKAMLAILEKNDIPLWQFLSGLGIEGLGRTNSKALAKWAKKLDFFRVTMNVIRPEDLTKIEGIGDVMAQNIVNGLQALSPTIEALVKVIDIQDVEDVSGPLVGKSFCMTGKLPSGKKRNDLAKEIEAAGGEFKSSVGKGLTYLVIADPSSTSSKAEKARKLGTELISEEQLEEMMA